MNAKRLEGAINLNVKIDESLAHRIDAIALSRSKPGVMLTRSDIARLALFSGVEALEKEDGKPPRKAK